MKKILQILTFSLVGGNKYGCTAFSPQQTTLKVAGRSAGGLTRRHAFSNKRTMLDPVETTTAEVPDSKHFQLPFWKVNQHVVSNGDGDSENDMMDLLRENQSLDTSITQSEGGIDPEKIFGPIAALLVAAGVGTAVQMGITVQDVVSAVEAFFANPQGSLQAVVESVEAMGPAGPLYFGIFYLIAEVLAIPATPLTMSAGYLFGLTQGVGIVLTAATIAASFAFVIGKTFLRQWVEGILDENPDFRKIDKAIGEQGFKLLILVRLSPIFPFALSNYVYGASSIDFASYFWGTLLGFAPGTIAYVYTGMVGKELMSGDGQPWYAYAAGFGLMLGLLKLATDVASGIVASIDDEDPTTAP